MTSDPLPSTSRPDERGPFAVYLDGLRARLGISSWEALADRLGLPPGTVRRWGSGDGSAPDTGRCAAMCDALDLSPSAAAELYAAAGHALPESLTP